VARIDVTAPPEKTLWVQNDEGLFRLGSGAATECGLLPARSLSFPWRHADRLGNRQQPLQELDAADLAGFTAILQTIKPLGYEL
jgi:hypothetical protein